MTNKHTDREYQAELTLIRDRMISMMDKVQTMALSCIDAYLDQDLAIINEISGSESQVNLMEIEIDDLCVSVLAKRQPVASDLRFIVTVLKIVSNIERIGDHASTICRRLEERTGGLKILLPSGIKGMRETLGSMLAETKIAFIESDDALASQIIKQDELLDAFYAEVFRQTLKYIENNPADTFAAMNIQSVLKSIERMGDHTKNAAELIVYMAGGDDVRHSRTMASMKRRIRGVLFLCVHNSGRSQMAEAMARKIFPPAVAVFSAGSDPAVKVNPLAVRTMAEVGIDISGQNPKTISAVPLDKIDAVITLCEEEICIGFPAKRSESWNLPDPAGFTGNEEEVRLKMESLRNELKYRLEETYKKYFL